MESVAEKSKKKVQSSSDSASTECRQSSTSSSSQSCSDNSSDEAKNPKDSCSSSSALCCAIKNGKLSKCSKPDASENEKKTNLKDGKDADDDGARLNKQGSKISEMEMMKERFAKLLLGEDMSGNGKGVSTALAISNAITNLCATVFGQLWRLEPLAADKKSTWQREMEWLLSVSHHIVELIPTWQTFPDGSKLEVMTCRPRSDIFMNLPALCKLDDMLLEILDSFTNREFWYVDQGVIAPEADGSASFRKAVQRQEDKWWLPVPRVPSGGLLEATRNQLINRRECASQILKASIAINSMALAEMDVPESYLEALPKNGRACLGDFIYRYITSGQYSSECLLDCLDVSSELVALEMANRVEASLYVWHRRLHAKPPTHPNRAAAKSSWGIVKDLMVDGDKRELLAERAENLLLCLKQRFPGLTQTTLDASKIQCNEDVGKAILESYSRVLESLAFNIVARIDDLLYVDDLTRQSDKLTLVPPISVIAQRKITIPCPVPASGTPYTTASGQPGFSPAPLQSPFSGVRTPLPNNSIANKPPRRGFGVKRALSNYLGGESKLKNNNNIRDGSGATSIKSADLQISRFSREASERRPEESSSSSNKNGNSSGLIDRAKHI